MDAKLRPLQDTVIPRSFGEVRYEHTRALILSDIGGTALAMSEGERCWAWPTFDACSTGLWTPLPRLASFRTMASRITTISSVIRLWLWTWRE